MQKQTLRVVIAVTDFCVRVRRTAIEVAPYRLDGTRTYLSSEIDSIRKIKHIQRQSTSLREVIWRW